MEIRLGIFLLLSEVRQHRNPCIVKKVIIWYNDNQLYIVRMDSAGKVKISDVSPLMYGCIFSRCNAALI